MNYSHSPEFKKDLKRLSKRWRSLPADIAQAEHDIAPLYDDVNKIDIEIYRNAFFSGSRATILLQDEHAEAVKMRLDVASLGNSQKVRVVFVAVKTENEIIFVELYAKNDKDREDPSRFERYVRNI